MKSKLLLVALIIALVSSAANCQSTGAGEWQILTKQNFSSQIRLHPHILLIVTVPWSGESRSLMKEVTHLVTDRESEFSSLKLMIIYQNTEKMLADAIGATEGVTVFYYHHFESYKYQGNLRAQSILFSIYPYLSTSPHELPLTSLNSPEDLKTFVESTDKALILLEFCGWTPKLLAREKKNGTENGFSVNQSLGNHLGLGFSKVTDGTEISRGNDNKKGVENGKLKCGMENGFSGIPWFGALSSVNDSDTFQETENITYGVGFSCNFEEFQQFESFFSKFMTVTREFFLPPERHRFGLVSDRLLLPYLGIEDSDSWLAMLYLAGCPSCSKLIKEGNDLKSVLQMSDEIVAQLDGDRQDLDNVLPANKPSILLFVDRSSDSSETRRKSNEALDALRELALHYVIPYQMGEQKNDQPGGPSVQASQALRSASGHPSLKLSPTAQKIKSKNTMSIMVINEGKQVTLDNVGTDLQSGSLHEMLAYLLQKKKEAKLSTLAKEAGFHLLSDDFDIKVADASPSQTEVQSNQVSPTPSKEVLLEVDGDPGNDQSLEGESISALEHEENSKTTDVVPSHHDEENTIFVDTKEELITKEPDQQLSDHYLASAGDVKVEEMSSPQAYKLGEPQVDFQDFRGSFFFCDGNYRLLRALTGGSTIPSLAIVDPIYQRHYVFPKESVLSYSLMAGFLHGFLNGSLLAYQRSESILQSPREATHPPFVNMDFHEVDSIPRVTTHTFSELVSGLKHPDNENALHAWDEDVLVLFSSGWCGFCQRMELVVREVYRAAKGYMKMLENGYRNGQTDFSGDNLKNAIFKLPRIYLMDCTLNDCSSILQSITQREFYPALMLFPAERKNVVSYEGDIAVADIIKFIADHGNNSHHLISEKGILWTSAEKGSGRQNLFEGSSPTTGGYEESSHEIILKSETPKRGNQDSRIKSHTSKGLHETGHHVVVGSVLIATDKLLTVHPFDNSKILIFKADQVSGFQGLIFNKHISWDTLQQLEEGLEFLKEAPLSFGGPLIQQGMPIVGLTRRVAKSQYPEVIPGVYFLDQIAIVNEIEGLKSGNHSIADYWFFLGFSSWSWDQLFAEIAQGGWTTGDDKAGYNLDWPSTST